MLKLPKSVPPVSAKLARPVAPTKTTAKTKVVKKPIASTQSTGRVKPVVAKPVVAKPATTRRTASAKPDPRPTRSKTKIAPEPRQRRSRTRQDEDTQYQAPQVRAVDREDDDDGVMEPEVIMTPLADAAVAGGMSIPSDDAAEDGSPFVRMLNRRLVVVAVVAEQVKFRLSEGYRFIVDEPTIPRTSGQEDKCQNAKVKGFIVRPRDTQVPSTELDAARVWLNEMLKDKDRCRNDKALSWGWMNVIRNQIVNPQSVGNVYSNIER